MLWGIEWEWGLWSGELSSSHSMSVYARSFRGERVEGKGRSRDGVVLWERVGRRESCEG